VLSHNHPLAINRRGVATKEHPAETFERLERGWHQ
jgi:hypothetical protein